MNKKAQQNDGIWRVWLFIFAFILAGVLIYLLGKIAMTIGLIGLLITIILFFVAAGSGEDEVGYFALLVLFFSLLLIAGGWAITHFFESNEVGKLWLGSGKTIINSTAEGYKTVKGGLL